MERISGWPWRSFVPILWRNRYLAHRFQSCSLTKDLREQYPQFHRWNSGKITTGWSLTVLIGMFLNFSTLFAKWTRWELLLEYPKRWPDLGLDRWICLKPQDPDCDDAGYAIVVENFPPSCWSIPIPVKTGFNGVSLGIWVILKTGSVSYMQISCLVGDKT